MTVVELKALGYDLFAQIQQLQANLAQVNQMIGEKSKVEEVTPEVLPETPISE